MWKSYKTWRNLVFICCLISIFLAGCINHSDEQVRSLDAQQRFTMQRLIIKKDAELTDNLNRMHNLSLFRSHVKLLSADKTTILKQLKIMQEQNPQIKRLFWLHNGSRMNINETSFAYKKSFKQPLDEAARAARKRKEFVSRPITDYHHNYIVMEVPNKSGSEALLGIVSQHVVTIVKEHQRKNLHAALHPNTQKRWNMETVDPNTLTPKQPSYQRGRSHYYRNQAVVKFKTLPIPQQLQQISSEINSTKTKKLDHTYVFESKNMTTKQLMKYFRKWNIVYAEPHFVYTTNSLTSSLFPIRKQKRISELVPNDTFYSKYQWDLPMIDTLKGWNVSKGNNQINVAVVDTGVDINHPDLKGHIAKGMNFINKNELPDDDVGHGTHVAGVIAAIVDNHQGVAGMTWFNRVMPVKVLDAEGTGTTYSVSKGIIWAVDHGAKVINLSLGNYADSQFLHDAIKYAYKKDAVIIAASGNDDTSRLGYPAAYQEVIAVGATNEQQKKAFFSNYGDYIDVVAPGVNIASTFMNNQYAALSGTSMASPHVTALAALIRSVNPKLKNTEVMNIIRKSARDLGPPGKDKFYGYGQIDVVKALNMATSSGKPAPQILPNWLERSLNRLKKQLTT